MKNKLLSILLTICMVALLLPVSVIPAYAETTTETRTVTWYMNSGHGTTCNKSDHQAEFSSDGQTMLFTWTDTEMLFHYGPDGEQFMFMDVLSNNLSVTFPYLEGTVTAVELKNLSFFDAGMKFSVGNGSQNLTNGNSAYCTSVDGGDPQDVTFTGSVNVDADHPLRFTFSVNGTAPEYSRFFGFWDNGSYIKVTYTPAAATDHGHSFNITTSGNVLTATCTNDEQSHQCITNHQATLTLVANDGPAHPFFKVSASLDPTLGEFNNTTQLGATCTVEYAPQGTSNWTTTAPNTEGNYTARATVSIGGTDYVLTSNFRVLAGYYITNNNPQQLSVNKTEGAMAGEDVIVTFTPKMGESVATMTVTGDTTSLSIGSGITDNGDNTYTFAMPNEDVTIGATFNFPANSNFTQDGNTYIIKNADGWDYFCQRMRYDANLDGFSGKTVELAANISVTKMAGMVHPFKGTFDGKGKTLTFNPTEVGMYTAPFQNTNGATICNLHVTGLIEGGTNSYLGGLVGSAEGNLTIRDCHVSTQISTTFDSNTLSSNVGIGGIVGYVHYTNYDEYCRITGTVYDGLIYNPNYSGSTYGCGGFVGCLSEYGHVDLTDCLFIEGQYDNNGGKHELLWGHDNNMNSTFFHRTNNQGYGTLKNCFFVATHFLKQGSPAVESTDAPDNFAHFGDPTDHRFMQTYGHTMVFNGKYYTPIYGDLVENYDYSGVKGYNIEYDDAPLGIPDITSPLWTDVLRYNRSFTKDKPVIVMLPFNFTKDNITLANSSQHPSGHFYSFAGVTRWAPVMESANEVTSMTANTPYLYVPGEDTEYLVFYLYDGFYIFTAGNNGGDKTAVSGDWTLTGTYTGKTWTEAEQDFGRTFILNNSGELTDVTDTTIVKPTDGYFVISVNTHTVTFDANGGTGTIAAETVNSGATYTLPDCTFTAPEGKIFKEWSVKIGDAEAVNKQPGDTIEVTADTTVTATWEWRLQDGYYLIGQNGWTADDIDLAQQFTVNPANANEYMLETTLAVGDEIKVVRVANGAIAQWFPDPGDNYTVAADYAGSVTIYFKPTYDNAWSAFGGHIWIVKKAPTFKTQSLILSGQIGLSFNMDLPDIEGVDWTESYMTFTIPHGTCTERADYADTQMRSSGTKPFVCYVATIQMAEPITATFHWTEGEEEKTIEKTYAIKDYFLTYDANKSQFNEKTQKLIEATADYGHYTQTFLAAANGWTLGEDYAVMDKFYATAYNYSDTEAGLEGYTIECNKGDDIRKIGAATVLDSETAIRITLTPVSGYTGTITATADGGKDATVTPSGSRYIVVIPNIAAHELTNTYTVTIGTENSTATVTLSALSYVKLLFNANTEAPARNAASAILAYATAANNYRRQ